MNLTKVARKFVQVSLPAAFAEALREQAEVSDRSMAAQIEHWARIAKAVEAVAPANAITQVKSAKDASDVLTALASFVMSPNVSALRERLDASGVVSYGSDPNHPDIALQYRPDGSVVRGKFDSDGDFVPDTTTTRRNPDASEPKAASQSSKRVGHIHTEKAKRSRAKELAYGG